MPYLFNTPEEQQAMLEAIGVASIDELFTQIPEKHHFNRPLDIPAAMGEMELTQMMSELSERNGHTGKLVCFLGGGSYDHFVPAVVDHIASRGEFYTSYTPYQPEVSQGNLQAMFEYQTLICQLTGLEVSNASLYDGGSAVTEAAMMCLTVTKRHGKIVVPDTVHPEYRQILATYLENLETELVVLETNGGLVTPESIQAAVDGQTACIVLQNPNFFGCVEAVQEIADIVHDAGALLVVAFDPISLGRLKRPGDQGADIAVAEGQSLGSPMQFGGPFLGIMACREDFVRRMPGRIAGQTVDRRGKRCWVLTLQTREQHIRRDKATSNICTNQGLFALRASIYLALLGPEGLRETADLCLQKAHYAAEQLAKSERFEIAWSNPYFKEFVVRDRDNQVESLLAQARKRGILAGVPLGKWYPQLSDCFLVAVTEQRTKQQIDELANCQASCNDTEAVHA